MLIRPLERKTKEAIVLAVLAMTSVAALRFPVESKLLFLTEMSALATILLVVLAKDLGRCRALAGSLTRSITVAIPILFAIVARTTDSPIAFEMTILTTFGAAALALSTGGRRARAMSLVSSGFLTLFAVAISDSPHAVGYGIAWMTICVWHLIANHWERLELCSVEDVRRGSGIRRICVLLAIAICIGSGLLARSRFGESNRLTIGFMPTSGGSQWSDPAARSGIGSGDAAIAAKEHAESFGAVESNLILESTESTLFDMFSDSIGEPKKKMKWERRQAMSSENFLEAHGKTAKSEKGGSSFSTDRLPAKKHLHLKDATERAVIQWAGTSGIRLAMNRYDTFDGVDWTNQAKHRQDTLMRREIAGATWFCDGQRSLTPSTTDVNSLKVLRLNSARLPVPMMTSAIHIKDVDRQDFFGIEEDGSFFMPGREKVPQLTVVDVASSNVMEDQLWEELSANAAKHLVVKDNQLDACVSRWTAGMDHPYEKLQSIVSHLRHDFTFDRSTVVDLVKDPSTQKPNADGSFRTSNTPLERFLQTKRGGDHLFATTAALMARTIGLQSRLVTGFYVRPSSIDIAAGHTNVLPEDVHVWAEIRLDDGRWFEIEPTPGYQEPLYTPSAWLVAKQFAAAKWPHALGLLVFAGLLFATRLFWIELGLSAAYPVGSIVWPSGRMSLAMRVLQMRAKYAGCPRVAGRPQRDWLLAITATQDQLQETARRFCDAADRAAFAIDNNRFDDHTVSKELIMKLKIRVLRQMTTKATA